MIVDAGRGRRIKMGSGETRRASKQPSKQATVTRRWWDAGVVYGMESRGVGVGVAVFNASYSAGD